MLGATEDEATGLSANPICREMAKRSSLPPPPLSTSPISPDASGDEAPHDACKYPASVPGTPGPSANSPSDEPPPVLPDDEEELACCSYWQMLAPPPMAKGYCTAPEGRPTVGLATGELWAAEEAAAAAAAACIWRCRRRERERRFWNQ